MSYVYPYSFDENVYLSYPKMLSPFVSEEYETRKYKLKSVLNDKVYDWVFENRYDSKTTRKQIVESYSDFLTDFPIKNLNK